MKMWSLVGRTLPVLSLSCFVGGAVAADKAGCHDPSWAPARLPGFEIQDCEEKPWVSVDLDLASGGKTVQGRRSTVTYELKDPSKDPKNETARRFYAEQGKKSGAQLMSDPGGGWSAILTRKTAQGEFWYSYEHGSGNEDSTGSYTLTTLQVAPLAQEVQVRADPVTLETDAKSCKDPGWLVHQFSYFKLDTCNPRDFDTVTRPW